MVVVSIAKGEDPYNTTMKALKNLLEVGVRIPRITLIKPNLLSTVDNKGCINTDYKVCEALVDFLISLGNKEIICAEGSTRGPTNESTTKTFTAFKNNDYYKIKEKISHYVDFNIDKPAKWIKIVSPGLNYEVDLGIAKTAVENAIASVAKFKTHDFLGLTLTLKNMMGVLCQARRIDTGKILAKGWKTKHFMHGWGTQSPGELIIEPAIRSSKIALAKNLIILISSIKPLLGVIDGIIAMEGDGPITGICKRLGIIIASTDPVACDAVACEIAGFNIIETGYIYAMGRVGLGEYRLENIEIVGEKIKDVKQRLKTHHLFPHVKFSKEVTEILIQEVKSLLYE